MQKLRSLHLYLGCAFAPILLFMAVSGIWQTLGWHYKQDSKVAALLSTIHTGRGLKVPDQGLSDLSSSFMHGFVLAAAVGFIFTVILGVVMALKFGKSWKAAIGCLGVGVLIPLVSVLAKLFL
jgi:hypothetical protein